MLISGICRGDDLQDTVGQPHPGLGTAWGAYFSKLLFPKSQTLMYLFWAAVFLLIYLLIFLQRAEVERTADGLATLTRSNWNWVLEPYVDPIRSADHVHTQLLKVGAQYFGKEKPSEAFVSAVDQFADDIRNGNFTDQRGEEFVANVRNLYVAYKEQHNEILKKSGFWYFYLLILIVAAYQIFVNGVYIELEKNTDGRRDTSTFLTEGAFNAIDLTILAGLTYMYFDAEWPIIGALVFVSYLGHMIRFGLYLSRITDRRTVAALSAYFLSVLMTLIMAGIENLRYLATGTVIILACVFLAFLTVRVIIPRIKGGAGRFAPYVPDPN
jgi:hypothetical protein